MDPLTVRENKTAKRIADYENMKRVRAAEYIASHPEGFIRQLEYTKRDSIITPKPIEIDYLGISIVPQEHYQDKKVFIGLLARLYSPFPKPEI